MVSRVNWKNINNLMSIICRISLRKSKKFRISLKFLENTYPKWKLPSPLFSNSSETIGVIWTGWAAWCWSKTGICWSTGRPNTAQTHAKKTNTLNILLSVLTILAKCDQDFENSSYITQKSRIKNLVTTTCSIRVSFGISFA